MLSSPRADAPPAQSLIPDTALDALDAAIAPRGPDGAGRFRDRLVRDDGLAIDLALVHRRLSILDPAGGAQPMTHAGCALAFNGCIYNHHDLRLSLARQGIEFATDHSDTEALLHLLRTRGPDALSEAEGMFALAFWDRARGTLTLARDRAGEKPLYVTRFSSRRSGQSVEYLAFASTVPAILAVRRAMGVRTELDRSGLASWLRMGFAEDPPLADVKSLRPGTLAVGPEFSSGTGGERWRTRAYFQLPASRDPSYRPDADAIDRLLDAAVAKRLESDVPLGCFLSGGTDSSLVAAYARKHRSNLATFCVRMPDVRYDESPIARLVARRLGTKHTTLDAGLDARATAADDLRKLIASLGLPLGDSSLLPTHWVSRAASIKAGLRVALAGDGGDELFGGYERYASPAILSAWSSLLSALPHGWGMAAGAKSVRSKLGRLAMASRGLGYADLVAIFPFELYRELLIDKPERLIFASGAGPAVPDDPLRADFLSSLPGDLLRKVDAASMAVPIEVRSPLLDSAVIDAAFRMPLDHLMPRRSGLVGRVFELPRIKHLLKLAARRWVPSEALDRPKMGFALPLGEWLRTDFGRLGTLARERLRAPDPFGAAGEALGLDVAAARAMLDRHLAGAEEHAQRVYALTVLSLWWEGVEPML
ncbi:MAG: asparagine synthase (glutamine-hydrolyzing) [Planctomycetota bacterium]|nr:asparagine synthase (glutamine-hydrolyzing) [Planctomycetota bacterium]